MSSSEAFHWPGWRGSLSCVGRTLFTPQPAPCSPSWARTIDGVQYEPGSFAASVNGRLGGHLGGHGDGPFADAARAGGCPGRAGQGLVRNQLGGRGRAWRILPGRGRRHLQELRARRHHRARWPQQQQSHPADRRQARFLHEREHAAVVRCRRQQRAAGDGRRDLPEGPAGPADASGIQGQSNWRT